MAINENEILTNISKSETSELIVDKTIPEKQVQYTYNYAFLLSQKEAIQQQIDARTAEMAEVDMLIKQAIELGLDKAEEEKLP